METCPNDISKCNFLHFTPTVRQTAYIFTQVRRPSAVCTSLERGRGSDLQNTDCTAVLELKHSTGGVPWALGFTLRIWALRPSCFVIIYSLCSHLTSFSSLTPSLQNSDDLKGFHYYHHYYFNKQGSFPKTFGHKQCRAWAQICPVSCMFPCFHTEGFSSPGDHEEYTEVFLRASPEFWELNHWKQ